MNRSYRIEDNSSNSFIPSYSGTNGAIATHSNLSSITAYNILNDDNIKKYLLQLGILHSN